MKFTRIIPLVIIFALAQVICRADQPQKWEYKVVDFTVVQMYEVQRGSDPEKINSAIAATLEKWLNKLAADGWELVSDNNGRLIFKRPISKNPGN